MMEHEMYNLSGQNRYKLMISGERFKNNPLELMGNAVTMPGLSGGITEVNSPMRPIPQPGGTITHDDLYMNFIISENLAEWIFIYNWIREINFGSDDNMNPYTAQIDLMLMTNKFNPLLSFTFHDAFPYVLGVIDFRDDGANIETLNSNVSFKFTDMTLNTTL